MTPIASIEDLRRYARRRLPRAIFDFVDGGAQDETSLRANREAFQRIALSPRVLRDVSTRDIRNGLTVPPRITLRNVLDLLRRPGWLTNVAFGPRITFGNLDGELVGSKDIISIARFAAEQYDPAVNWDALEWCKAHWPGPIAVKCILTADGARTALERGADALIVSNHGGRQLDGTLAGIAALPAVVDAVHARAWVDARFYMASRRTARWA